MSNLPTTAISGQSLSIFNEKQLATLKATIAKDATNEEFQMFVEVCNHAQLNPFINQIYFIKMGGKPTIQISAEGVQAIARRREDFDGIVAAVVKENDDFEADIAQGTVTHKVKSMVRGQTVGSYCIAKRKGFPNVLVLVTSDQVEHYRTGGFNKAMWTNNYEDMIQKHAIKRACKLQFGIELELDDEGSIQQGTLDKVGSYTERGRVDMGDIEPSKPIVVDDSSTVNEAEEMERQWAKIKGQTDLLGWKDIDIKKFIAEKFQKKAKELSLQELVGLSKLLDFEINKLEQQEQQPKSDSIFDAI